MCPRWAGGCGGTAAAGPRTPRSPSSTWPEPCCREDAAEAAEAAEAAGGKGARWLADLASTKKISAVERLARSDPRHARAAAQFDADRWLLNTPGGVVDLRTGETRAHRPAEDLFTKATAVAPGGECPRWQAFLREITQGDAEVVAYLQRWAGYILTGSVREDAFLFLHGPGGNGKGTLFNTLAAALGDYATTADKNLLTVTKGAQHPTGLADLRGARLVLAPETEAGQVLAEALIKSLTGGDRIKARFMRGDFFEYDPAFKLVMLGNHRPVIRNPGEAIRRRLHLLPLTYKPPRKDEMLRDRLRDEELPGILAWALEGCAAWQRGGLGMPRIVREATESYLAEQDVVGSWLSERCEPVRTARARSLALFEDWSRWARQNGEEAGSHKAFSEALERHHPRKRDNGGAYFLGLRLRSGKPDPEPG